MAVHAFAFDQAASGVEQVYSARRGECAFDAHTTIENVVVGLVAALHRIRLREVDPVTGMLPDWPHLFPTGALERLAQRANRHYGYRPLTRADLDHHHPARG